MKENKIKQTPLYTLKFTFFDRVHITYSAFVITIFLFH